MVVGHFYNNLKEIQQFATKKPSLCTVIVENHNSRCAACDPVWDAEALVFIRQDLTV
jgi:hypothetical protein